MDRIYLDFAATTPIHHEAKRAMLPWLSDSFGNPSSSYEEGRRAKEALDQAREVISSSLGCLFGELVFTSGGTEAANLAIIGSVLANSDPRRNRVLFGATEHHCVLNTTSLLERLGCVVETIAVGREGVTDLDRFKSLLGEDVLLVSVMRANNELGVLQPVNELSRLAGSYGALFHCDSVQSFLANPETVSDLGVDLLTVSAHKVYGPKGAGALYVRSGVKIKPIIVGGGQERELRAGTENVAAITGFAAAVSSYDRHNLSALQEECRQAFIRVLSSSSDVRFDRTVQQSECLPGHLHLRFPGLSAESMLIVLDRLGVSASSGAACSAGSLEPSHVLKACGYSEQEAGEGLRFTFGSSSTPSSSEEAARRVVEAARQVAGKNR